MSIIYRVTPKVWDKDNWLLWAYFSSYKKVSSISGISRFWGFQNTPKSLSTMKITASVASKRCDATHWNARNINMTTIFLQFFDFNKQNGLKIVRNHVCNLGMTVCNVKSKKRYDYHPFWKEKSNLHYFLFWDGNWQVYLSCQHRQHHWEYKRVQLFVEYGYPKKNPEKMRICL